ncbi:MAG: class 1 fructose-bisphosphatase [Chloroflexi bacterium]|nr:class 1 fructose-bisphosphatase [Chloroflexota bacterium]
MSDQSTLMTIERYVRECQEDFPDASGTFTHMLYDIALAAKLIARETTRAGIANILGEAQAENVYGERQQKLDLYADECIFKMNDHTGRLAAMASEEHEEIIAIPPHFDTGKYVLLYDPLDGSSNIDVNVSVGTIFAIHRKISSGERGTLEDMLQPGRHLAAAGYVIYGSSTMMVYSSGRGVHGFTLDPSVGEFLLSHEIIQMPRRATYYSCNHGNELHWMEGIRRYVRWLQGIDEAGRPALSHRYIGSLVADFHRNLLRGGVFLYPGDRKTPNGKLRLLYECQAMAFLAEQAGGYASDGIGDILDLQPHDLHQRNPFFVGNLELVQKAEAMIRAYDGEWVAEYRNYRDRHYRPEVVVAS